MTYPTGALSVVAERMKEARESERLIESMTENKCWNTAITLKSMAEAHKQQAGVEFLLWVLAVLQQPHEPNAREIEEEYEARKASQC